MTAAKIVKSTSKGQITIPKAWRKQFKTENFMLKMETHQITLKPVRLEDMIMDEEVIFDADRDNKGKGISPDSVIRMLRKIKNG